MVSHGLFNFLMFSLCRASFWTTLHLNCVKINYTFWSSQKMIKSSFTFIAVGIDLTGFGRHNQYMFVNITKNNVTKICAQCLLKILKQLEKHLSQYEDENKVRRGSAQILQWVSTVCLKTFSYKKNGIKHGGLKSKAKFTFP